MKIPSSSVMYKAITAWKVSKYGVFSRPYSVQMRKNTDQKKLRIWTLFTQCKLRLSSHNLAISTAELYKLRDDQNICSNTAWEMMWEMRYVLFDCDNYSTLRQDTFKKIKTIDNTELDTRVILRKERDFVLTNLPKI